MIPKLALVAAVIGTLVTSAAGAAPFCQVVVEPGAEPLVRQAATELSGYLSRLTGGPVPVVAKPQGPAPAIVLRTEPDAADLGEEEYFIAPSGQAGRPGVAIRGRTPQAVLHGAYRLLRAYGIGFYFDGDAIPAEPPRKFLTPNLHAAPVFAIRGSLPWYNFFDSPTTWDDQDFRFFADQIIRSGQNFIGFHTYDNEPFAAYEYDGQLVGGEPLLTTAHPVWGTYPLRVDEFGFGTGVFFPGEYWGSDAARAEGSREERIRAQKALLARGLAYASARGVKTCLGFEVSGEPTDPAEQSRLEARLRQLLADYPMLDYVWLWQPEARSLEGTEPPPLRSPGGRLFRQWQEAFQYVGRPARRWEGMRMAAYGRLAQHVLDGRAPSVRLVLSGWGGDHHLHVSDYFPAWDRVLDKRIIFAALDDIRVSPQVSQYYDLPPDRERWAIPWYEFDGDQWFPQANCYVFTQTVRDARQKGCQGLLAIHWRTKEVGESQALCAQYAWNPDETLEEFFRDYGLRRVGRQHGPDFGAVLQELDAMGYRWLGGPGQAECGSFAWCHVADPAREKQLRHARQRLAAIRTAIQRERGSSGAVGRVEDVLATIDRVLLFNRIAADLVAGGPVERATLPPPYEGGERGGRNPARVKECRRLLKRLTGPEFGEMLNRYAQTITSRGELGVLATVNAKAFVDYRDQVARLREAGGETSAGSNLTAPSPHHRGLLSDCQQTSVPAGTPLPVRVVAYDGGKPARNVVLAYTTSHQPDWIDLPMKRLDRSVFEATIPGQAVTPGWVRYRITAQRSDGPSLKWPAVRGEAYRQVHVFPAEALVSRRNEVLAAPPRVAEGLRLTARVTAAGCVQLSWTPGRGLPQVAVERRVGPGEWQPMGATGDWEWEDATAPPSADLAYRLLGPGGGEIATASVRTPASPPPQPPADLSARARGTRVRLTWAPGDLSVSRYSVERGPSENGPFATVTPDAGLAPRGFAENGFTDRPGVDGTVFYRVRAHAVGGGESEASAPIPVRTLADVPAPLLDLDFDDGTIPSPTGPAEFSGPHTFEKVNGRGVLRTEGGFALPYGEEIAVRGPFTIAVRFRQSVRTPIPVLVCQGAWLGPGYFLQLLGENLRFYVGGAGCLDQRAPVEPGAWHTAVGVYDGVSLLSYLDGVPLGERAADGPFTPATLPFTVARYSSIGPEWTFVGDLDFVRLYGHALEPWMVMRRQPQKEPILDLDWSSPEIRVGDQPGEWHQEPRLVDTEQGRAADLSGGLTLPFGDLLTVGDGLTLETGFRLRTLEGMPVLVNQGAWPGEGYLLQILGGRLRFHVGGVGSLDCGPEIRTGRWYAVRCTYDGQTLRAYLDGERVGELSSSKAFTPSRRPLRIGRYEDDAATYVVDGLIGRTRIYAAALE